MFDAGGYCLQTLSIAAISQDLKMPVRMVTYYIL